MTADDMRPYAQRERSPMILTDRTVASIARGDLLTCSADTTLADAARRMQMQRCSSIVVIENGRPVGIWTERDALLIDFGDPACFDQPISTVMSAPVITIDGRASVSDTAIYFRRNRLRHLLVVDAAGAPTGIVSQTDVVLYHGLEHYLILKEVRSVLSRPLLRLDGDTPLSAAMAEMRRLATDAIVVNPDARHNAMGIITERDVVRFIAARLGERAISGLATRPLYAVAASSSLLHARNFLVSKGIRHLGVTDEAGEIEGVISYGDILANLQYEYVEMLTEALRERDEALRVSRQNLRLAQKVIEASLDGVVIVDREGRIEFVNPAFTRVTGYEAEEVIGETPAKLRSGRHGPAFYREMWQSLKERGFWQGEIWNRRKNGEIYPEWLTITAITDEEGETLQYAGIFSDITERKQQEESIRRLAYFDELTGLPNRRLFNDRLSMAIARAKRHDGRLAVVFLDLDMFKRINDSLGHSVGDAILAETAQRLRAAVTEEDTVARLGGDEFILLLNDIDHPEAAGHIAHQLVETLNRPFFTEEGNELFVTASMGVSVYPEDGATVEDLVRNADTAMYRSKDLGRNNFSLYTATMNQQNIERLAMESHLRHGLERGEFHLVYQPKIDAVTGTLSGVETLLRWRHPDIGYIPPTDFIPLAEETGMIAEIGEWVMRTACAQNRQWQDMGLAPLRIAVNVSPREFHAADLPARIRQTLADTELGGTYLEIEITEGLLMERIDRVAQILTEIRQLGVRIAIDDFGTGFSSLNYLKRMPIDALKIDRSFVNDIFTQEGDAEIVATIIAMAGNMGLTCIAEGVETEKQMNFLRQRGCDELQGYFFAAPMAAEQFEHRYLRGQRWRQPA